MGITLGTIVRCLAQPIVSIWLTKSVPLDTCIQLSKKQKG